jgi:hypothetical protein
MLFKRILLIILTTFKFKVIFITKMLTYKVTTGEKQTYSKIKMLKMRNQELLKD